MSKKIKESLFWGWRSSALFAIIMFSLFPALYYPNIDSMLISIIGGFGWAGWAAQEWQHLNGYIISKD